MEKVERLEQGYNKLRKVSEFIMSIVECMDPEDLKRKAFEKGKRELSIPTGLPLLVASRRIPNLALMVPFCEGRRNGYPLSNNHS